MRVVVRVDVNIVLGAASYQRANVEVAAARTELRGAVKFPWLEIDHSLTPNTSANVRSRPKASHTAPQIQRKTL